MDIGGWLRSLGLERYEEAFRENEINYELGVNALGHRRILLDAIAAVRSDAANERAASAPLAPAASSATIAEPVPETRGERRYLTVMFCDLVGSTGIAAKLDAEEWRDLVGAYLDVSSASVTDMGGGVAKKLGDGLMALFGYPIAQENDAERAVRAALAIQRALTELNRKNAGTGKPELTARIGIETGHAVVDASGEIYGDVANVAARVQALGEPGAVLATSRVQRQVAGLFVAEECGTQALKGVPEPVALYRIVRASGGGRRSGQRQPTPLIGREEEMAMMMRRWERARQGDGQFVLIVGEPGLGKSRLLEEFHSRLSDTPHTWTEWSFLQLLQNTPLHAIGEWGRQRFGGADVSVERRLADLENSLSLVKLDPAENIPLLAPPLDIPLPPDRASTLPAEELRRRQLAALTAWSLASAHIQPLVLALEDLHWADPTSLELLRGIAERGALAPLLVVATTRPEFRPPWGMRSHHVTISLAPLDRQQVREMVAELSSRHALAKDVVEDVAARTGGVPLFVEEVTRLLLERNEQGGIQVIPPTLQQSLMARLDRLGPAREVAQIGSVIGRGFSYRLLRDVAGMEGVALQAALEKLAEAAIVLVQGLPPDSDYRFKHALIQDAAYENLLKSRRQVLHRRVAETMRDRFGDSAAAEPEALAHHFTQAGMTDDAIEWWGKAGDQALRRSAFQEAISHLGKAIEMADADEKNEPRAAASPSTLSPRHRLELNTSYARATMFLHGFAAKEAEAAFARAGELAVGVENPAGRFTILYGQWVGSALRGELGSARHTAEIFLREAGNARSPEAAAARRALGLTCLVQGELVAAHSHFEEVLKIYDSDWSRDAKFRHGMDCSVSATTYLAHTTWQLGEVGRARPLIRKAVARALESAHVPTLANTYYFKALFEMLSGDTEGARSTAESVVELSREHGLALYMTLGQLCLTCAQAQLGDRKTGINERRQALAEYANQGNSLWVPFFKGQLAEIEAEIEGSNIGLTSIQQALAIAGATGERWSDAFLHCIRGKILLNRDPANTQRVEEAFHSAITIAQQQKAQSFGLRASLALANLYQSAGRAADAYAVLAPALTGFSPTAEFPEIEAAQKLLAALLETDEVTNAAASRQRRLKLQTSYAQALQWSKGYVAEEATAAFKRAQQLAAGSDDEVERFKVHHGQFVASYMRAELKAAQETAETLLRSAEIGERVQEVAVAETILGLTLFMQGAFADAYALLENALRHHDRHTKIPVAIDTEVGAKIHLAYTIWVTGDFARARDLINESVARAVQIGDPANQCTAYSFKSRFEMLRGDAEGARWTAEKLLEVSQQYNTKLFLVSAEVYGSWARARLQGHSTNAKQFQQALVAYADDGNRIWLPLYQARLAEIEADSEGVEVALARIDGALALAADTREHWSDALLHRCRGEILLKHHPAEIARAEEAFRTAIAMATQQKARSFELLAALALAKLCQSENRAADAQAVLAPALEGFSPTPELPEIEEAQALLTKLAETDEVKAAAAARERRLKLQTAYGMAVAWSRGFAAEETKAAFARANELTAGSQTSDERFTTLYGQWVARLQRAELDLALETAEAFLREAVKAVRKPETVAAHRYVGLTCLCQGKFVEAQTHLEEVLKTYDASRDRDTGFRFGTDSLASAKIYLAYVCWQLGDFVRARELSNEAIVWAAETGHAATIANVWGFKAGFEMNRGDAEATLRAALALAETSRQHKLPNYEASAKVYSSWARARLGADETSIAELRRALTGFIAEDKLHIPSYQGRLAEIEAGIGSAEAALVRIDEALALANETGQHQYTALLARIRGDILLKLGPANAKSAEETLLNSIAIAQQQCARTDRLHASLTLAKHYTATSRTADARVVLAPALEGLASTPELPEIEEARTLLETLSAAATHQ